MGPNGLFIALVFLFGMVIPILGIRIWAGAAAKRRQNTGIGIVLASVVTAIIIALTWSSGSASKETPLSFTYHPPWVIVAELLILIGIVAYVWYMKKHKD
jgi:uncharacterized membrane protein YidH (DUF202 family)